MTAQFGFIDFYLIYFTSVAKPCLQIHAMKKLFSFSIALYVCSLHLLTAQSPAWPDWVFKHWVWEDESTQQSALQLVDDYQQRNIPVSAIIIDSPWETGYNTFEWDTSLYPNAQAMVDSFHARNVKVVVWITTAINTDQTELWHYADSMGYFMKANAGSGSAVINWWKGDGSMIDFFNPDAVNWWKTLMDKTLAVGIDGWKCDGTDYSVLLGNALYSPGAGAAVTRLQYSHAYYRLFFDYTRQQLGNDRIIMSRPVDNYGYAFITDPNLVAFTPRDIGFACWVGDQDATYDGMEKALNNMYQSDANNYLVVGSDIGGYRDEPVSNGRTKDVFLRWAQLGAFSPLMENGGGGEHRPWMWDPQTEAVYNTFVRLHHAMVPYLMQQSDSLFSATQSLMQFFNSSDYQYMLGSDIFVAPVLGASGAVSIGSFPVNHNWVYLFDNSQIFTGGGSTVFSTPIDQFPVFIKAGSPLLAVLDSVLSSVTGVSQVEREDNRVNVFPNPAANTLVFAGLDFKANARYVLSMTDISGRKMLQTILTKNNVTVPVQQLAAGAYFYTICTETQAPSAYSGKLIIQR